LTRGQQILIGAACGLAGIAASLLFSDIARDYDLDRYLPLLLVVLGCRWLLGDAAGAVAAAAAIIGVGWSTPPHNWGELAYFATFAGTLIIAATLVPVQDGA
jgi:drug/metabolite transporter (DMT)-like permease